MMPCGVAHEYLHRYVDGELPASEQMAIEAHLLECPVCRAEYQSIREVVDAIRGAAPLYPVPAALPGKVEGILLSQRAAQTRKHFRITGAALTFAAVISLCLLLPDLRSSGFVSFAAETHRRHVTGSLPLSISSEEPSVVSGWLESHGGFPLRFPNFPAAGGEPKSYSLTGARLVRFKNQDVAYLAYTMHNRAISLLVAPELNVLPDKYESYKSGRLVFYFSRAEGANLITWKDHGLSYALVSDLEIGGAQSCIICHGSQSERRKFENLLHLDR